MRASRLHSRSVKIQVPDMTKYHIKSKTGRMNWRVGTTSGAFCWCLLIVCAVMVIQGLLEYEKYDKVPKVKMSELAMAIDSRKLNPIAETVLAAILNDWMDLQYGVETAYTRGQTVVPMECTIEDVKEAIKDETVDKKFKDIFVKIWETYKSGSLTPQSRWTPTSGWDPNLKPVLVFVTPDVERYNYYPELYA